MVLPPFPRRFDSAGCGSARDEEPSGARVLRLIQIRLATPSLERISSARQDKMRRKGELPMRILSMSAPWGTYKCVAIISTFKEGGTRRRAKLPTQSTRPPLISVTGCQRLISLVE